MKNYFTDGFYKSLLIFSVIILSAFGVLVYLGIQNEPAPSTADVSENLQPSQ